MMCFNVILNHDGTCSETLRRVDVFCNASTFSICSSCQSCTTFHRLSPSYQLPTQSTKVVLKIVAGDNHLLIKSIKKSRLSRFFKISFVTHFASLDGIYSSPAKLALFLLVIES